MFPWEGHLCCAERSEHELTNNYTEKSALPGCYICMFVLFLQAKSIVKDNLSVNALSQYSVQRVLCSLKHDLEKKGFHIG